VSVDAIEKALSEFELIGGVGVEADKKACAMTLLAWVCGEPWTDHPPCAQRVIANNVVRANDASSTTPEMRRELVRAGRTGVLDTWWVPGEAIAMSLALCEGDSADVYERTMRLLERIAEWKGGDKKRPVLSGADLRGADLSGADLSRADLSGAVLSEAVLREAVLRGAVLSGAVLRGAVLRGADLSRADLREAVLSGADLSRAVLSRAVGTPYDGMPSGWKLKNGLWGPDEAKVA
jgi:hypothetical protein